MTPESRLLAQIRATLGRLPNVRLFRNNVGTLRDREGRYVQYGLCQGSADLIGWVTVDGVARFTAIECKSKTGRVTDEQDEPTMDEEPTTRRYPADAHCVPLAECPLCDAPTEFVEHVEAMVWTCECSACGLTLGLPDGYSSRLDLCRDWNRRVSSNARFSRGSQSEPSAGIDSCVSRPEE